MKFIIKIIQILEDHFLKIKKAILKGIILMIIMMMKKKNIKNL